MPTKENRILMLKVTNRCNNKCIFCCDRKPGDKIKDINLDLVKKTIHKTKKIVNKIHIIGGEPTFYPKLVELTELINSMGFNDIFLETNATNFSPVLIKTLIKNNVNTFIIGLHTNSEEIYSELTGNKKGLEKCLKNIEEIIALEGKVIINLAVQLKNYKNIKNIVDQLQLMGVKDFIICSIIPPIHQGYSFKEIVPTYTEVYPYLYELIRSKTDVNINLQYFPYCIVKEIEQNIFHDNGYILYVDMNGHPISLEIDWTAGLSVKSEKCKHCKYNVKCSGVFKDYVNNVGWDEFNPVLN